jgi:hypothetical protein
MARSSTPTTAWQVGEDAAAKRPPLRRFGCAVVRRPVREAIEAVNSAEREG